MAQSNFSDRLSDFYRLASEATGMEDFGSSEYIDGLDALMWSIDEGPPLTDVESDAAQTEIVQVLKARLITQDGWKRHPDALAARIARPVVILGLPCTDTTALHQLLSIDPRFQGIENWLTRAPMVRPPRGTWAGNPHFQAAVKMVEHMRAAAPEVGEAHLPAADEVDECLTPLAQNFVSNHFACFLNVPGYDLWYQHEGEHSSYRRYVDILKLVEYRDHRQWLLKNPRHLFGIDALLAAFPDACVIQTHRDPSTSIASLTSLVGGLRDMMTGTAVDRVSIQKREIAFWSEAVRRGMAAQDRDPDRFFNVDHRDLRGDPLRVVHDIYRHFAIDLSSETEAAMRVWAQSAAEEAKHSRTYAAVRDASEVAEAFATYINRYAFD